MRLDGLALDGGGGGSPSAVTFLWELVCDIDFTQEPDQALSGGNLTVTNRVDGSSVVLAGQTVAIVAGALAMTAASGSNIGVAGSSVRTGAFLVADTNVLWPDFDGQPIRCGAEVATPPTYDAADRAWGVLSENSVGIGGGSLGAGYSAEIRATGAGTATRRTRSQAGSSYANTISSTAYAAGRVCGIGVDGRGQVGLWSLTAGDLDVLDEASAVGPLGLVGNSVTGTSVTTPSRFGVFAVSSSAGVFVTSIKRLVLWARVARVA